MRSWRVLLGVGLILPLIGCTLSRPLAHHAVSYNKTVETTQNRMLLLNVVRASKRQPMYFTGIGSITASPSYSLSSGKVSLAESVTKVFKETTERTEVNADSLEFPTGSFSNKPTLQMGVLDSQEFIRGILNSIDIETVAHYLRQGWRPDVLAYLLVERVETTSLEYLSVVETEGSKARRVRSPEGKEYMIIENDPSKPSFGLFQQLVENTLQDAHCDLQNRGESKPILSFPELPPLRDVVKALEAKIGVRETGKGIEISRMKDNWSLHCFLEKDHTEPIKGYIGDRSLFTAQSDAKESRSPASLEVAFILRSPHSVLYYLGEILETIETDRLKSQTLIPTISENGKKIPLFWATLGDTGCSSIDLSVEHRGQTYKIPGVSPSHTTAPCNNRSMQALALASQLLGLHKSAKDLPGTTLVRIVGD